MLPMPGSAAPAAHASGPRSACAHFASKKLSALVATIARLMKNERSSAIPDSMKLYHVASWIRVVALAVNAYETGRGRSGGRGCAA